MHSLWYEEREAPFPEHNLQVNSNPNELFNHCFVFANPTGDFPAGWMKYRGSKNAEFIWEQDEKDVFGIMIRNRIAHQTASICQQRSYAVPVYDKQVWEIGAKIKVNAPLWINIKVHHVCKSSRVLGSSQDFLLDQQNDYCSGLVTIPAGVDFAYIELGTRQAGVIWVEDVVFRRVFPLEKYSTNAQGRINVNTIEVLKKIAEPVEVRGSVELKGVLPNVHILKNVIDLYEDLTAEPLLKYSKVQDISQLNLYSFCVINLGPHNALIQVQISPDGINWVNDGPELRVIPNIGQAFTANYFLRYIRLACTSGGNKATHLKIFFQAQA